MYEECLKKQENVKEMFAVCKTDEEKYQKIIALGHALPPFDPAQKIPENEVKGCQSLTHLFTKQEKGLVYFQVFSDALISAGLGALLLLVYSGEAPETILKCPPDYLEQLGIRASLSPSRANGLYSIYLRMKQEALKCLVERK
jgi:cysteine desulfuration protein SufE